MVVNRYASQQAELESALSASRSQLEGVQQALSEREQELQQLRAERGASESATSSRTSQLEAELTSLRQSAVSSEASITALQDEVATAKARADALEEKLKGKASSSCSISLEEVPGGAGGGKEGPDAFFPGVLECGRSVKFSWALVGKVRIQWYRAFKGGDWQVIPGKMATKPNYLITADDIGASLKAEASHIVTGESCYAETAPVHPYTPLVRSLGELLRKLDATFTVESANATDADKTRRILLNKEKVKLQDSKGKTVAKKEWGEAVRVTLDGDSERRFSVQIEQNGPVVNYIAQGSRMRDLIVVTIRMFLWLITKHQGRLNKDLDHDLALSLYVRTLAELSNAGRMGTVPAVKRTSTGGGAPAAGGAKSGSLGGTPSKGGQPPMAGGGGGW